ncbi:unnamed protein product [Musa acuminata subsp. malaccensis]|uniref:(wild Malaysian banana) hypothetical protein n=1 Tax=Musa acuminata subsp. malaccensis TaxID=214687 RepID=A0A804IFS4_MUSAM|nr:PREDICTED: uncharacterized protein LOC103979038 [Musa acuminata subsp. malaccensis]CAG1851152.1 unnamed protein product [Musa acuminata subsp. malaccensis]
MNRRIRCPNPEPSTSRIEERLHRFLKPGALARLRDSRISSARPGLSVALLRLSSPSSRSPAAPRPAAAQNDGIFPCFAVRAYGPRFLQRRKLAAAAKSIFFAPPSPDLPEPVSDAFPFDLVAAR